MRPHTHTHSHKWVHIDSVPWDSAAAKRWQISSGHLGLNRAFSSKQPWLFFSTSAIAKGQSRTCSWNYRLFWLLLVKKKFFPPPTTSSRERKIVLIMHRPLIKRRLLWHSCTLLDWKQCTSFISSLPFAFAAELTSSGNLIRVIDFCTSSEDQSDYGSLRGALSRTDG